MTSMVKAGTVCAGVIRRVDSMGLIASGDVMELVAWKLAAWRVVIFAVRAEMPVRSSVSGWSWFDAFTNFTCRTCWVEETVAE